MGDFEVKAGSFTSVGTIPHGIAITAAGVPVPTGKLPDNITGSGMKVNIGDAFNLYVTGFNGLTEQDRIRLVKSDVACGDAGASRNTLNLLGSDLSMGGDLSVHSEDVGSDDRMLALHWKGLSLSAVGAYRVCWCPALEHNCDANSEFMVDTGTFEVIDTSASGAWMLARDDQCDDNSDWQSPYGEDCIWHLKNDPGCKKFRDMGQLKNCPSSCHNCEGLKPFPSEVKTTCTMTSLCQCYSSCDPPAPCPVGDDSHDCMPAIVDGLTSQMSEVNGWLEIEVAEVQGGFLEPILGVQVQGDSGSQHHVTEFKVQISTVENPDEYQDIDGGRVYAGNWDGRSPVVVYFTQGATPARRLRILPVDWAGSPAISAKLVHKRCKVEPPLEEARTSECLALMCKSYCHKRLGCQGEYVDYCEMRKKIEVVGSKACDVDCSGASTHAAYLSFLASSILLLLMY